MDEPENINILPSSTKEIVIHYSFPKTYKCIAICNFRFGTNNQNRFIFINV